jgi:hypothetical protein
MQKNIYIQNEPVYINTPYGIVYIECMDSSKELVITIHNVDDDVTLLLGVPDKDSDCDCDDEDDKVNWINEDAQI